MIRDVTKKAIVMNCTLQSFGVHELNFPSQILDL